MEILPGARCMLDLRIVKQSLNELGLRIHPLSERIGYLAAALIEEHALTNGLRADDAIIAATAMEAVEVLATGNARQFRPIRKLEMKAFRPRIT